MSVTGKQLTATFLKGVLTDGLVARDVTSDFNNFEAGVYTYSPSTKNIPDGLNPYGMIITFVHAANAFQIAISQFGDILMRIKWGGYVRQWRSIEANVLTT